MIIITTNEPIADIRALKRSLSLALIVSEQGDDGEHVFIEPRRGTENEYFIDTPMLLQDSSYPIIENLTKSIQKKDVDIVQYYRISHDVEQVMYELLIDNNKETMEKYPDIQDIDYSLFDLNPILEALIYDLFNGKLYEDLSHHTTKLDLLGHNDWESFYNLDLASSIAYQAQVCQYVEKRIIDFVLDIFGK